MTSKFHPALYSWSRTLLVVAFFVAVTSLFICCRSDNSRPSPTSTEKVSLRLQWLNQAQFAGFYVAKDCGFYEAAGLDVTINPGGQDFNAATLVASGSDDFGIWTADQVLLARSRGVPIHALGVVFDRSLTAFMVKQGSGIRTPKDFEGKTVGMYYGYDSETIYLALLRKYNVDRSKIHETALQYDLARFFAGEVDVWPAYVINQPIIAAAKGVPVELLLPTEFGIRYYSDTIITNDKIYATKPDTARRFLAASERGWRKALQDRDMAVDAVLKRAPHLDRADQRRMLDVIANYVRLEGAFFEMEKPVWDSIRDLLVAQGLLISGKAGFQFIDFAMAREAHETSSASRNSD